MKNLATALIGDMEAMSEKEEMAYEMEAAMALGSVRERQEIACSIMTHCQANTIRKAFEALTFVVGKYNTDEFENYDLFVEAQASIMANFERIFRWGESQ